MDQSKVRKRRTRGEDISLNEQSQLNFSQSEIASESETSKQTLSRRRKTSADDILRNEPQINVSQLEIASESETSKQTLSRRRKTSAEIVVEASEVLLPDEEENLSEDFVLSPSKITNSSITTTINQIRAELMEEKRSSLVEAEYWDETHSWGFDDDEVSDEYWHFVGKYE